MECQQILFINSADKEQQESRAVAQKALDAVVKFDTYRNLQRHRAVVPGIARLSNYYLSDLMFELHGWAESLLYSI